MIHIREHMEIDDRGGYPILVKDLKVHLTTDVYGDNSNDIWMDYDEFNKKLKSGEIDRSLIKHYSMSAPEVKRKRHHRRACEKTKGFRTKKCRGYKRIFYKYQSEFSSIIPECEYETEIIRLFNTLSAGIDQIEDPDELDKRWDEVEKLRNIGELVDRIKYIRIKHYGELIRNFIVKIKELDYYKDNINNNKRYDNIQRNWDKIICKNI